MVTTRTDALSIRNLLKGALLCCASWVFATTASALEAHEARILSIFELETTSVVLVDAGYEQGFRRGMKVSVESGDACIGELLLVDTTESSSIALITSIEANRTLNHADTVRIKTFQFAASWK